jgi:2-amino-4-hydroxy-6-hydroxymethyldihydropteridine diphosphokinase
MAHACVAIGSNLGDRESFLDRAVRLLECGAGVRVVARSRNYETIPDPPGPADGANPMFLNGAVVIETTLSPGELLKVMQGIETRLGRPPVAQRQPNQPRTIDLDLLLYDEQTIQQAGLIVPHPRMHLRRFVLEPLAEIAPAIRHPVLNVTVGELLSWLNEDPVTRSPSGRG